MTHPNRVTPTGDFIATPERGLLMGNRGVLHDDLGVIGPARWKHRNWVCCALSFKGRRRHILQPRTWTELFFLDEAVALAAGHRPCAECRRADYLAYRDAWACASGRRPTATEMDKALHAARAVPGARQMARDTGQAQDLPDGAMFLWSGVAHLRHVGQALPYSPAGYGPARPMPRGDVTILTPAPTRYALVAGYIPILHPTATGGIPR